jgi:ubiquinone/menaquinone biosynthesis C-methylase UbiE
MTNSIQAAYDRWSSTYDTQPNPTRDIDAAVLHHILPDLTGLTVVEAGCGTGKNTGRLAAASRQLIALDFSQGMIALARQKHHAPHIHFTRCDLNHPWPLAAGTADLVIFNLVLEHIQHLSPIFTHAARVLRPHGRLLLSEFHPIRLTEGKGAQITASDGRILQFVGSYRHQLQAYQTAAATAGLTLVESQEWTPPNEQRPLLLTIHFQKHPP